MRAVDKINTQVEISECDDVVDKGYRCDPNPFDHINYTLAFFDFDTNRSPMKLIWLLYNHNCLDDNSKLFDMLEVARTITNWNEDLANGCRLSFSYLYKIISYNDKDDENDEVGNFFTGYLMDELFYEFNIVPLQEMLKENFNTGNLLLAHDNNNVNYDYLDKCLNKTQCYSAHIPLIERLLAFGEVEGWEDFYGLGMYYYDHLNNIDKKNS
jgi:hypothetical protein